MVEEVPDCRGDGWPQWISWVFKPLLVSCLLMAHALSSFTVKDRFRRWRNRWQDTWEGHASKESQNALHSSRLIFRLNIGFSKPAKLSIGCLLMETSRIFCYPCPTISHWVAAVFNLSTSYLLFLLCFSKMPVSACGLCGVVSLDWSCLWTPLRMLIPTTRDEGSLLP